MNESISGTFIMIGFMMNLIVPLLTIAFVSNKNLRYIPCLVGVVYSLFLILVLPYNIKAGTGGFTNIVAMYLGFILLAVSCVQALLTVFKTSK